MELPQKGPWPIYTVRACSARFCSQHRGGNLSTGNKTVQKRSTKRVNQSQNVFQAQVGSSNKQDGQEQAGRSNTGRSIGKSDLQCTQELTKKVLLNLGLWRVFISASVMTSHGTGGASLHSVQAR